MIQEKTVDQMVLKLIPMQDDHVTFNTLRLRFCTAYNEDHCDDLPLSEGEVLVHESLKRLRKAQLIEMKSYPNMPLCYSRLCPPPGHTKVSTHA